MLLRFTRLRSLAAIITVGSSLACAVAAQANDPQRSSTSHHALGANAPAPLRGTVIANGTGIDGATVTLWQAGHAPGTARALQSTTTGRDGEFALSVAPSVRRDAVLYITARDGRSGANVLAPEVEMATSVGDLRRGHVTVNERTTVAAGYALAQFANRGSLGGSRPGLPNAALMPRNLVDLKTGQVSRFLAEYPNGESTETLSSFNSLASIIAGCVARTNDCAAFLDAATDAWGERPRTTWEAMTLLPTAPGIDPDGVFAQVPANPPFEPVRSAAPTAWNLALRFYGNGQQFNGPGNIAFDARGRVWANNNAQWSEDPAGVCPGLEIFLLDPFAPGRPMQTFYGGGLNGAGFGIAFDTRHHLWIGNFGFTGSECAGPAPTSNSVSEFRLDGKPISGSRGYRNGPLSWPQGTKSDTQGNIWIGSCGNDSLVMYPKGRHRKSQVIGTGISRAFDVAQNAEGNVFVTANGGDQVFGFEPDGTPLDGSPFGDSATFDMPLGAASDSLGNVWVSNSGVIQIPCNSGEVLEVPSPEEEALLTGSIARVEPDGATTRFYGAGMTIAWGIAVDGDDNIWVANFSGARLSHLCGARASTCPAGKTGHPISKDGGYPFDGLQRNTGVQVDPSGNVWLTNNWIKVPVQTDPFGDGLVVFLGVAAPVSAPLVGTPR